MKEIDTEERTFFRFVIAAKVSWCACFTILSSPFAIIMYRQLLCSKGRSEWQIIIAFHLQKSPRNEHKGRFELTFPFVKGEEAEKDWERSQLSSHTELCPTITFQAFSQLIDVCRNLAVFCRSCYKPKMNSFKSLPVLLEKLPLGKTRTAVNCNKCCSLLNNKASWAFNLFINNYYGIKSV